MSNILDRSPKFSSYYSRVRANLFLNRLTPLFALVAALIVGAIFILAAGANPLDAYREMIMASFGSRNGLTETLVKATPLALIAVGTSIAYRCKIWSIGQEGQMTMGAIFSAGVALGLGDQPSWFLIPLLMVTGFLGGALWGIFPAMMKTKFNVDEIISSLMLNTVALLFGSYLVNHPWRQRPGFIPQTPQIPITARLPILIEQSRLHIGILVVVVVTILFHFILWKTTLGYQIRAVGNNPKAAAYGGINVVKSIILAMILSGGLAGLAGMIEVTGIQYRLKDGISMGYGYTAIVIALMGKLNPIPVTIVAILFGALIIGADAMQFSENVPVFLASIIQGAVVLFILLGEPQFLRRK
ncbi:MAG: ABC transporter permease [Pelolinea sp.]|nr:ABC transporter permease [Pelolinea sp.]